MDTTQVVASIIASLLGGGGITMTIARTLWRRHEKDLEERAAAAKAELERELKENEKALAEAKADIKDFRAEVRRLNDERHELALRRGTDTAQALTYTVEVLGACERVIRDNTAVIDRLEVKRERQS